MATAASTGSEPTTTSTVWDLLAEKGDVGEQGTAGPTGPAGAGLNWRGDWAPAATYEINDLVADDGSAWIATAVSTGMRPSGASVVWDIYSERGERGAKGDKGDSGDAGSIFSWRGVWDSATTYELNDLVRVDHDAYVALRQTINDPPATSTSDWSLFAEGGEDGDPGDGFNWRGLWDATTAYAIRDVVARSGSAWVATQAGTGNQPSGTSAFWDLFAERGEQGERGERGERGIAGEAGEGLTYRGAWDSTTAYAVNDIVGHDGSGWIATQAGTGNEPASGSAFWDPIAEKGAAGDDGAPGAPGTPGAPGADGAPGAGFRWRGAWDSTTAYEIRDVVEDEGSTWLATAASTGMQPSGASTVWDLYAARGERGAAGDDGAPGAPGPAGDGFRWRGVWSATTAYAINDLVRHEGTAWLATVANTGSEPADNSSDWAAFAEGGDDGDDGAPGTPGAPGAQGTGFQWQGEWDNATAYAIRDVVHHMGSAWIATAANTGNTPSGASLVWDLYAERGEAGADGTDGSGFRWRGEWDDTTAYAVNDIVRHNGIAWRARGANTNDEPR